MNKNILLVLIIFPIIAISGCVNQELSGKGISVKAILQPSQMYSGSVSTLYIDVENNDISAVNANVEVFDTGILSAINECKASYSSFLPKEIKTLECKLKAPSSDKLTTPIATTGVNYKVSFSKKFSAPIVFQIYGYEDYAKEGAAGTLDHTPQTYSFSDPNLRIDAEFTKQPPFVAREGEKALLHVNIQSIGNGFLKDINPENFEIKDDEGILDCDFPNQVKTLTSIKGRFPPITCEVKVPVQKNYLRSFIIIFNYKYDYEIRGSIPVSLTR